MTAETLTELAPAKINLTLRVGAPRADGYHPLDSLVVFADWGDAITVADAPGFLLSLSGEAARGLSAGGDNLVMQAALALQQAAGIDQAANIRLHKRIPVEAGLGGGSADAAATLRALNTLWDLNWPLERLAQLAVDLGADIPACLYSRPLRMRGIGEWIEVLDPFPGFDAVIVNPGIPVPTGPVFKSFDAANPELLAEPAPCGADFMTWLAAEPNDLEAPAISIAPGIAGTLNWLNAQAGVRLARMSGSGASCFALCDNANTAGRIAADYDGFAVATRLSGSAGREAGAR